MVEIYDPARGAQSRAPRTSESSGTQFPAVAAPANTDGRARATNPPASRRRRPHRSPRPHRRASRPSRPPSPAHRSPRASSLPSPRRRPRPPTPSRPNTGPSGTTWQRASASSTSRPTTRCSISRRRPRSIPSARLTSR
jgi:hypothetical protein